MKLDKILVPVDFSPCSGAALRLALELQVSVGARVEVLHAFDIQSLVPPYAMVTLHGVTASLSQHWERDAKAKLERFLEMNQARSQVTYQVRLGPNPALATLDRIDEGDIDLVVLGTHGGSGFTRWLIGSTTEKLLRGAPCPILTVRCAG